MIHLRAYAKINPFLEITGKRDDGYHELSLIFRPVSIYDELFVEKVPGFGKLSLSCSDETLEGKDNIIFKAYEVMKERFRRIPSLRVRLIKNIPQGAGMGGGSSDAAAFLKAVCRLTGLDLSPEEMFDIGALIGADVPACMLKTPSYSQGAGDEPAAIPAGEKRYYIGIKPAVSFNTAKMYGEYDRKYLYSKRRLKSAKSMISAINCADPSKEAKCFYNIFEKTVPERKLIADIKKQLVSVGAIGALMTGSGSAVMGIFADKAGRNRAFKALCKKELPFETEKIFTCESVCDKKQKDYFVYIFECADKTLYTGYTTNLDKREAAHNGGISGAKYTKSRGGGRIVYSECYDTKNDALRREYKIKQMSRKDKILLVNENIM